MRVERIDEQRYRASVAEHALARVFGSADEARNAGTDEVVRLEAIELALLRRIRCRSSRKQR